MAFSEVKKLRHEISKDMRISQIDFSERKNELSTVKSKSPNDAASGAAPE